MMRLDKFLADMGYGTRSEIKNVIRKGNVSVNGKVVIKSDFKVNENVDSVVLDKKEILYNKFEYFMLNKPGGYVSATTDKYEKTVIELLREENKRKDLFPIGRLDKDTEGLLIISNDGELAHKILSPKKHVPKTYYVKVSGELNDGHIALFRDGLDIGEKKFLARGELVILNKNDVSEAELTIYEGKFHQVKRMFEAVGMKVVFLKRIKMGKIELDENLLPGDYRRLTQKELEQLKG